MKMKIIYYFIYNTSLFRVKINTPPVIADSATNRTHVTLLIVGSLLPQTPFF